MTVASLATTTTSWPSTRPTGRTAVFRFVAVDRTGSEQLPQAALLFWWDVLHRQKDIQYSSRVATHIARQLQTHRLRHVIGELLAYVPEYKAVRTFAVDRIASVSLEKQTFTPRQQIGEEVFAVGHPLGLVGSLSAGVVSGLDRSFPLANGRSIGGMIQFDAAVNPGNSGGPLFNLAGEVVGINSQIYSRSGGYMGISFAIPIDLAMNAVDQLKKTGRVSRGQLGVIVQPITSTEAKGLGLSDSRGALITQVLEGSPADKAGIEVGDVITAFNDSPINQSSDLPPLVGSLTPGTKAKVKLIREGKPREETVVLTELEEDQAAASPVAPVPGAVPSPSGTNPLGIVGQELDAATRKQLGLRAGEGVLIARVNGVAAREAGLEAGTVVLQVGRAPVGSPAELNRELAGLKPGDTVMLLVRDRREGTRFRAVTVDDGQK